MVINVSPRKEAHGTSSVVGIGLVSKTVVRNADKNTYRYSHLCNACGRIEKGDYALSFRNQQMSIKLTVDCGDLPFIHIIFKIYPLRLLPLTWKTSLTVFAPLMTFKPYVSPFVLN